MNIEIINSNGDLITNFVLESNPFTIGETIHINVSNNDKDFWNIDEIKKSYIIKNIQHFLRKTYSPNRKHSSIFTISVEVVEVEA